MALDWYMGIYEECCKIWFSSVWRHTLTLLSPTETDIINFRCTFVERHLLGMKTATRRISCPRMYVCVWVLSWDQYCRFLLHDLFLVCQEKRINFNSLAPHRYSIKLYSKPTIVEWRKCRISFPFTLYLSFFPDADAGNCQRQIDYGNRSSVVRWYYL